MWRERRRVDALCPGIRPWPPGAWPALANVGEEDEDDDDTDLKASIEDGDAPRSPTTSIGEEDENVQEEHGQPSPDGGASPPSECGTEDARGEPSPASGSAPSDSGTPVLLRRRSFSFLEALGFRTGSRLQGEGSSRATENPVRRDIDVSEPQVVLGHYMYRPKDVVGQGGFSTVYRGVDLLTGEPVAIKSFSEEEDPGSPREINEQLAQFQTEVQMLQLLHQPPAATRSCPSSQSFVVVDPATRECIAHGLPHHDDLFVGLRDFSRCGDLASRGQGGAILQPTVTDDNARAMRCPGAATDGRYYLVLEMAVETMESFLDKRAAGRAPLQLSEVRQIFRNLCEVVTGLHGQGFVHLDLKPANLMRFPSGRFKLIDMDGVQPCGRTVPITEVVCTAKYCAPEVADAALRVDDGTEITVSRLMDVFSLGLIGAELAVGEHPSKEAWDRHMCGASEDEEAFYRSIVNPQSEMRVPPAVWSLSPELDDLLRSMLRKQGRASMPQVLAHPFWCAIPTSSAATGAKQSGVLGLGLLQKSRRQQQGGA